MPVDMKLLIAETFGKLAQRENIDKITVKALIEECHISRQTFYYHFQDIMDVLEWSVRRQTQALLEQSLAEKDLHSALQIFISFTVQQFPLLQKLMNFQRRPMFEKLMTGALETYLTELMQHHRRDVSVNPIDRDVLLQYNVCGLAGTLLAFCGRPDLVQAAGQLSLPLLGGRREQLPFQIHLPQRKQGIQDQYIRVQIQHPVQLPGQELGRQQPVIHLPGILGADRRPFKKVIVHPDWAELNPIQPALAAHGFQGFFRDAAVHQVQGDGLPRVGQVQGGEHHLQRRQIAFVQSHKDLHSVFSFRERFSPAYRVPSPGYVRHFQFAGSVLIKP